METRKPFYLFAGGRGHSMHSTIAAIQRILKESGKANPDLAFIGAASFRDNWIPFFVIAALIKIGCKCRVHRVVIAAPDADLNKARTLIQGADVVFFSGGDMEVGMDVLRQKNMVEFFREMAQQDKLFIGVSAGSIMMAQAWVSWPEPGGDASPGLYDCLALVPFLCDTHAEKDDWFELKTALELKGDGAIGYGINSGAYLMVFPDGRIQAKNGSVACFTNHGGTIEQKADMSPDDHFVKKS